MNILEKIKNFYLKILKNCKNLKKFRNQKKKKGKNRGNWKNWIEKPKNLYPLSWEIPNNQIK